MQLRLIRSVLRFSSAMSLQKMAKGTVGAAMALFGMLTLTAHAQTSETPGAGVGIEPTYVMVIDQDYVVDQSIALEDLRPRVTRLTGAWERDLNDKRLRLKAQMDEALLVFEAGDAQLTRIEEEIQAELVVLGEEVDRRKRRLNEINVRAVRLVRRQVTLAAQQLAQARGANMVINKGQGIWVPVALDLTEQVLAQINLDYLQVSPLVEEIEAEIRQIGPAQ